MKQILESMGSRLLERFVPEAKADAAGCKWYSYNACWQCANGPNGFCGYNAPCRGCWNGSSYTYIDCYC